MGEHDESETIGLRSSRNNHRLRFCGDRVARLGTAMGRAGVCRWWTGGRSNVAVMGAGIL